MQLWCACAYIEALLNVNGTYYMIELALGVASFIFLVFVALAAIGIVISIYEAIFG